MSNKRGPKPARPPPPRLGLPLGGMSFKKLEQEDEEEAEDLTVCTDKYASIVQHARSNSVPSNLAATKTSLEIGHDPEPGSADGGRSSPAKKGVKSMLEYKEILVGLKDRIHEKITKKIEDLSGDSSASTSPDKEHALSGPLGSGRVTPSELSEYGETVSVTRKSSAPDLSASKLQSISKNEKSDCEAKTEKLVNLVNSGKLASVSDCDTVSLLANGKGISAMKTEKEIEEKIVDKNTTIQPILLSNLKSDGSDEEDMLVIEEHFKEPAEDFTGCSHFTANSFVRSRSKLTSFVDKTLKVSPPLTLPGPKQRSHREEKQGETNAAISKLDATSETYQTTPRSESLFQHFHQKLHLAQWQTFLVATSCVFAYYIIPMPSFLSGLIAGIVLTSVFWLFYAWIFQPPKPIEPIVLTPLEDLPPIQIPAMMLPVHEDGIYKGWMNEIMDYNPNDYHINNTHCVFVTLEGTRLRLQRPKNPIPKRAMHDESLPVAHFIHQRHFELKGSNVFLLPPGLIKKRIWSKKYPICVALAEKGTKSKSNKDSLSASSVTLDRPNNIRQSCDVSSDMGFEILFEEKCDTSILYLFTRTGREKEEWYNRFKAATQGKPLNNPLLEMRRAIDRSRQQLKDGIGHRRHNSLDSSVVPDSSFGIELEVVDPVLDFTQYMGKLMPTTVMSNVMKCTTTSKTDVKENERFARSPFTGQIICEPQLYWLNALIGRCFYDFLRDAWWNERVKEKLQRKLSKIHVPYFIEELQVTAIDMGKEVPIIRRAGNPYFDERGFWVDLEVSYGGGFHMTIETKMNLMKLKRSDPRQPTKQPSTERRSPVTDSEEEDSAESSTDEEEDVSGNNEDRESGGQTSKKILKYLDKLTQSRYFQQATEYKYIKRAMENVSNTPLQLAVQLKSLVGKLAINVPPPPTDRLWYGFRGPPRLKLVAKPQVGERAVTITHITDWIERKLEIEFQRVFVIPNMDDLVIPILRPGEDGGVSTEDPSYNFES